MSPRLGRGPTAAVVAAASLGVLIYDPQASAFIAKTTALTAIALVALAASSPRLWRARPSLPPDALLAWLGLLGWFGVSLAWSPHPQFAQYPLWLAGAGLGVGCSALPQAQREQIATHFALVVGGATGAAIGVQLVTRDGIGVHGGHGNPNWAGLVVAVAFPLVVHAAQRFKGWWRAYAVASLALSALAIAGARSHTAWLALAVAALLFGRRRVLWAAGLASLGAYTWYSANLAAALAGRVWIWEVALDVAAQRPLFGHGAGEFPFAFLEAQGSRLAALPVRHAATQFVNATTAHSDWLQTACEGGLLGVLGLLLVGGLGLRGLAKGWRAGAASVTVAGICMVGDSPLHQPGVVALLGLVLSATRSESCNARAAHRRVYICALAVALCLAALSLAVPHHARRWLGQRAWWSSTTSKPSKRLSRLHRAVTLDPRYGEALLELGLAQQQTGHREEARRSLRRSARYLANVSTAVARGNLELEAGNTGAAIEHYRAALAQHPALVRAHINLAEALRQDHQLARAQTHVTAARTLLPNLPKLRQLQERLRRDTIDAATRESGVP